LADLFESNFAANSIVLLAFGQFCQAVRSPSICFSYELTDSSGSHPESRSIKEPQIEQEPCLSAAERTSPSEPAASLILKNEQPGVKT
jgi:hypothetical protein